MRARFLDLSRLVLVAVLAFAFGGAGGSVVLAAATSGTILGLVDVDLTIQSQGTHNLILGSTGAGNTLVRGSTNTGTTPGTTLTVDGTVTKVNSGQCNIVSVDTQAMAAGVGGGVFFQGQLNTTGPTYTTYAGIQGTKSNGTNGNLDGLLQGFTRTTAGTLLEAWRATPTQHFYVNLPNGSNVDNGCMLQVDGAVVTANAMRATVYLVDTAAGTGQGIGPGIGFGYQYQAGSYTTGSYIQCYKENATSGNYSSAIVLGSRVNGGNLTNRLAVDSSGNTRICAGTVRGWTSSTSDPIGTALDVGFSRLGAASAALGNGTDGNGTGTLTLTTLTSPSATTLALQRAGTTVGSLTGIPTASAATSIFTYAGVNGCTLARGLLHANVTTSSGTSVNLGVNIPAGATIVSETYRITTTITGASGNIQLQDAAGNVYLSQGTLTANTTAVGGPFGTAPAAFFNNFYNAANTFKIVTTAGTFSGGVVEVEIYYDLITAPTS